MRRCARTRRWIEVALVVLVIVLVPAAGAQTAEQKLTASDGAVTDLFGRSVAISGNTAIVSAVFHEVGAKHHQGSAYVFVRRDGVWKEQAKLTVADGAEEDHFGASVAIKGDTAIVGADSDDVGTNIDQGSAYVFVRQRGVWKEQAKLTASDGGVSDQFGKSVEIRGDTAIVGAIHDDVGANRDQGSVYVFVRRGGVWTQQQKLTANDGAASDQLGFSVALGGGRAIVGANLDDMGANRDQGSAYVFDRDGGDWTQSQQLTAGDGAASDAFGGSVAIKGDTAVVGASGDDVGASLRQGSAYVFVRHGGVWTEQHHLTAGDGTAWDHFGGSVGIGDDTAIAGAFGDNVGTSVEQGSAYVFVRRGATWVEQQKLTASDGAGGDTFGYSVAMSGETALVGAFGDDIAILNDNLGSAYVYAGVPSEDGVRSLGRARRDRGVIGMPQARPIVPQGAFLVTDLDGHMLVLDQRGKLVRRLPVVLRRHGAWGGLELAADRRHAFMSIQAPDRPARLYEVDLATGNRHKIANAISPVLSPDGRLLAYLSIAFCRELRCRTALIIRDLRTGDARAIPFAEGIVGGNRPELVINWSPDGRRVVLFDREQLRLVDVATAADIPSQAGLTPAYAPVFLDADTLVVLANCCRGPQQLITIDVPSGAISPFAELSAPPELIRRLKPGVLLTVTALSQLVLVSRGHTRVIASGITAAAG